MAAVTRRATTVGATELSYLTAGQGPLVVAIHGAPTGAELWRTVLPLIAGAGFQVVAPDLPGYGRTRIEPTADHSLSASAELLATWIRDDSDGPAWIIGHDIGGGLAQILAVRHAPIVAALTLVNSVAEGSWPAPRARFARWAARAGLHRATAAMGLTPNRYLRQQFLRALADPGRVTAHDLDRIVWDTKFTDAEGRATFERHLAALHHRDTSAVVEGLRGLDIPSQLIWGLADPFQPWDVAGQRLRELLPDPDITLFEDCGHLPMLEQPERLAATLLDWPSRPAMPRPDGQAGRHTEEPEEEHR